MVKMKVGVIGLGGRGGQHVRENLCPRDDVSVTYVCDLYEDRCLNAVKSVEDIQGHTPKWTQEYRKLIESPDVEVVIVTSAWENHIPACVYAMRCGKQVATEVGGAYSLDDFWELVRAHEETGIHCMMLENCCYDADELMALRMVREGVFGKIVYCEGGYHHDLRHEIASGEARRHYRLRNYQNRNCENYPTHELGPIAKILDINRGNRMVKLTSMASGAWGLNDYARKVSQISAELQNYPFKQGDIVKTNIQCAHDETICLTLDTTLPRYYTRGFTVRGTNGFFNASGYDLNGDMIFVEGENERFHYGNRKEYEEQWMHPIWKHFEEEGVKGGHGGMDWLVFDAYFTSLKENMVPPIDTYDTASWMAITPLSEASISNGNMPVDIPDFTRGKWTCRTDKNTGYYSLDR